MNIFYFPQLLSLAHDRIFMLYTETSAETHLAETFVVKDTQSVTKESGVVPVMSSHCAGDVPPKNMYTFNH